MSDITNPVSTRLKNTDDTVAGNGLLNRRALRSMRCRKDLVVIDGATHLFEEPGTLDRVVDLAGEWFTRHLTARSEADAGRGH